MWTQSGLCVQVHELICSDNSFRWQYDIESLNNNLHCRIEHAKADPRVSCELDTRVASTGGFAAFGTAVKGPGG